MKSVSWLELHIGMSQSTGNCKTKSLLWHFTEGKTGVGVWDDFQASGRVRRSTCSVALLLCGPLAPSHDTAEVGKGVAMSPREILAGQVVVSAGFELPATL